MELEFVAPGSPQVEDARRLFKEYADELDADLCFQAFQDELDGLPGKYTLPKGALVLARVQGEAAACGAFRPLDTQTCELKRFYVRPAHRQAGVASAVLARLTAQARKAGYERVVLDTLERLGPALAFYARHGFAPVTPYYDNPLEGVVYLGRSLWPSAPVELRPYLDMEGRVERMPLGKGSAAPTKMLLDYLAAMFEPGRDFTEREVNELLNRWHTFRDHARLRRDLVDRGDLRRTPDGARYWKP